MELSPIDHQGVRIVEGRDGAPFLSAPQDVSRLVEACFSARTRSALLYARNLTDRFFDLSSGQAGEIVQKLRTYRIHLAVVCAPGEVRASARFDEFVAAERRHRTFALFETPAAAREWLAQATGADR
jgi:uncharacterized protein DUF4180